MRQGNWPLGWIDELCVERSRVFVEGAALRLSKVSLLLGKNGSGKTFLFRLLNSLSPGFRHNLGNLFIGDEELAYAVQLRNPEPHEIRVEGAGDRIAVYLDRNSVPFIPLTVDIFFQRKRLGFYSLEGFLERKRREFGGEYGQLDDLALLSEYWNMTPDLVRRLVPMAGTFVEHAFDSARFVEIEGVNRLLVNDKRWRPDAPIHKISGGMLEMLSLDMAIANAIAISDHLPAMLLLHTALLQLDYGHMGCYVDFLTSAQVKFQTLIATPDPRWASLDIPWEKVRLERVNGRTVVEQMN